MDRAGRDGGIGYPNTTTTTSQRGVAFRGACSIAERNPRTPMDRHEKGIEKEPGRLDRPLPEWNGSYSGDQRRLPKVVQKLAAGRTLTAEEKAELLWRFYEIDQRTRTRQQRTRAVILGGLAVCVLVYLAVYQRVWIVSQVMAWLSPPPASPL